MIITRGSAWEANPIPFDTVSAAIDDALTPSAYSYGSTRKDRIEAYADKTREMLSRLVAVLVEKELIGAAEFKEVLGSEYEVHE